MGWWWNSTPSQGESLSQPEPPRSTPSQSPPNHTDSREPAPPAHPNPVMSRDELADLELATFIKSLRDGNDDTSQSSRPPQPPSSTPLSPNSKPTTTESTTTPPSPTRSTDLTDPTETPANISPETLYPTSMSCRSAFDYAFFCQSLGGQWVNVYRYGELRSCSEHWSDFWFCMRTRSYSAEEKARMVADRYRRKAVKYKTGPSSEDVWDVRTEPVKGAFQGDLKALEREMTKMKAAAQAGEGER
ncbi:conserved hypothetical protein [Histoplasma capsulatum G186AR]|uniref:Early meiotic induction protein 1 n=2 Tax=Ajellomyces capsulatus TaxID=5037 RepID=C0NYC4_AJECG|nr:uncharacterized protein HCBG_07918 [Histoplasma capsulatum G186AR]EEH03792.1 conserved hypothetical protein [Histoplasma capsulatum G186AR]KAG5293635.1 DUF3128 superfamily domain-containing protein [Histoplasma capsulatum]QSS75087.1 DUF3128 superfamily domain-containing protein [Histoplasma capsulatum G186AR]